MIVQTVKVDLLIVALVIAAAPCRAEMSETYGRCMEAHEDTSIRNQVEICIGQENERDDRQLNRIFGELRGKLNGERRHQMIEGQKAWLNYRTSWCKLAKSADRPPSEDANEGLCIETLTKEQIAHLK